MPPLLFPRSYWVEPRRFLAGLLPGDPNPVKAQTKLSALAGCGVTYVINLMEEDETDHSGALFADYGPMLREVAAELGGTIGWTRRAVPDLGVPTVIQMSGTLDLLDAAMLGGCVYVHCWGGRGRTGTVARSPVAGCWLARHGYAAGDAVLGRLQLLTAHNRAAFGNIPETLAQREFVKDWRAGQ